MAIKRLTETELRQIIQEEVMMVEKFNLGKIVGGLKKIGAKIPKDKLKKAGEALMKHGPKAMDLMSDLNTLINDEDPVALLNAIMGFVPEGNDKMDKAKAKLKEFQKDAGPIIKQVYKAGGDPEEAFKNLKWEEIEPVVGKYGDFIKQFKGLIVNFGPQLKQAAKAIKSGDVKDLEPLIGFEAPASLSPLLTKVSGKVGPKMEIVNKFVDIVAAFPTEKPGSDEEQLAASFYPKGGFLFEASILPYVLPKEELNEAFRHVGRQLVLITR